MIDIKQAPAGDLGRSERSEINMYIWWLLLYGFIYSVSERLSRQLDRPYIFFAFFISLYWGLVFYILYRKNQWKQYGICRPKLGKPGKKLTGKIGMLCLLFAAANLLVNGGALLTEGMSLLPPWPEALGELVTVILLVWGEEVFFRGVLPEALTERMGAKAGRRISILLFALLHLLNIWQVGSWRYVLVQTICAFVLGSMLLVLRLQSGSLFPGTVIHVLINLTAVQASVPGGRIGLTWSQVAIYLAVAGVCLFFYRQIISQTDSVQTEPETKSPF